MSWRDLEQLYRQGNAGPIPTGWHLLRGRAIHVLKRLPHAGTNEDEVRRCGTRQALRPSDSLLTNQWGMGIKAVHARLCHGASWLDGGPSIIMDYRGMAVICINVRDELRACAGLYVGIMYQCKKGQKHLKMFFALEMTSSCE